MDDGLEGACTLRAPRHTGMIADTSREGFSVPEQQTADGGVGQQASINHTPVLVYEGLCDELTNSSHAVDAGYHKQVQNILGMRENGYQEWDAVADEHVDLQKQLDDMVRAILANEAECIRLVHHPSADIHDVGAPIRGDNATAKRMPKLEQEITAKNALSNLMQAKLGPANPDVENPKTTMVITQDETDMISEQLELAMMELIATNEVLIRVKANSVPTSIFQINSSICVCTVKTTRLLTYNGMKTLDIMTSFQSTRLCDSGSRDQGLSFAVGFGIPLIHSWTTMALR